MDICLYRYKFCSTKGEFDYAYILTSRYDTLVSHVQSHVKKKLP